MRECLAGAIEGQVRLELAELDRLELEGTLGRDLERFVRQEVELGSPLVPRRFEVSFGTQGARRRAPARPRPGRLHRLREDRPDRPGPDERERDRPGLQVRRRRALGAADRDRGEAPGAALHPRAARPRRHRAARRALPRARRRRGRRAGSLRDSAAELMPGVARTRTTSTTTEFWAHVDRAVERAQAAVARIRAGDVEHDPRGGTCPTWCDRWPMCRVKRA